MSVRAAVTSAVAAAVDALALTDATLGTVPAAVARKKPTLADGEAVPLAVVTVADEPDPEELYAGVVMCRYVSAVTIVTAGGDVLADSDALADWREAVRKAVADPTTYAAVTGFDCTEIGRRVPFDRGALDKTLNYTVIPFTAFVKEART